MVLEAVREIVLLVAVPLSGLATRLLSGQPSSCPDVLSRRPPGHRDRRPPGLVPVTATRSAGPERLPRRKDDCMKLAAPTASGTISERRACLHTTRTSTPVRVQLSQSRGPRPRRHRADRRDRCPLLALQELTLERWRTSHGCPPSRRHSERQTPVRKPRHAPGVPGRNAFLDAGTGPGHGLSVQGNGVAGYTISAEDTARCSACA